MFGFCQSFAQSRYINADSPMALRSESPAGSPSFKANQPSISVNSEASSEEVGSVIKGDPGHLDILMGRAKNSQQHSGNLIFQKLILANIKAYTNKTRGGKGQIVKRLLAFLRLEKKVRFLKRLDDETYVEILDLKVLNDKGQRSLKSFVKKIANTNTLSSHPLNSTAALRYPQSVTPFVMFNFSMDRNTVLLTQMKLSRNLKHSLFFDPASNMLLKIKQIPRTWLMQSRDRKMPRQYYRH